MDFPPERQTKDWIERKYFGTLVTMPKGRKKIKRDLTHGEFNRVQTGVRIDKGILKVLKATAEYHDISLGEMIEVLALYSFEGQACFSKGTLKRIAELKKIYEVALDVGAARRILMSEDRALFE